jgi:propanol-preferring alcohol dehydrogenase
MALTRIGTVGGEMPPLDPIEREPPAPAPGQVRLRVLTCGVCHTELDEIEGRTPPARLPRIPGHQVVGVIDRVGPGVTPSRVGERVGVAWIFHACGRCRACRSGRENLCADFIATGRDVDGGYAEFLVAPAEFVVSIPPDLPAIEAAPLLCAGAIGVRALRLAGLLNGEALGLTGFGASGHLVLRLARQQFPDSPICVFARTAEARTFATELGAAWAGDTAGGPPMPLDAIIDTTPAWTPMVRALGHLAPGGRLVINAIRKESADQTALLELEYARDLWQEKSIRSVANVTRQDVGDCLRIAAATGIRPAVTTYPLDEANRALIDLKQGGGVGAKVLVID